MSAPRKVTAEVEDLMQDARDRGWTREEIAESFRCSQATVDAYTTPAPKWARLTQRQRGRLVLARQWGGILTVRRVLAALGEGEPKSSRFAVRHALKRLVRRGYLECLPWDLLSLEQRTQVLEESHHERTIVFALTPKGLKAARDTVRHGMAA